jgi:7-cyano-7-deazaguanine tRNA-ribosyltransferase
MCCRTKGAIFEIRHKDLLGRIGLLRTPRHSIETPAMMPVINPSKLIISTRELYEEFGVRAVITNAYLVKKLFREEAVRGGIHGLLQFDGLIATDSGAYQILKYGAIDAEQQEILEFQEAIRPDIGVILDIPTGSELDVDQARLTVEETLRRADEATRLRRSEDIVWVGPIQGGVHLDLVRHSAREMAKRPYQILALGSPTIIMERYQYVTLIDMIMTAKMNVPPSRPFHLFGAGHPSMMAFAVALGCDLFDSAAYALFAYKDRYMTEDGTLRLENMEYLPCECPVCSKTSMSELKALGPRERAKEVASHNLWVTLSEIRRIKQAIRDGRMWELLERRSRAHPSLQEGLLELRKYREYLERHSPSDKPRGIFYYGRESIARPEIERFRRRLTRCFGGHGRSGSIMFITCPWGQSSDQLTKKANLALRNQHGRVDKKAVTTIFIPPLGPIPLELLEAYPAGKIAMPQDLDEETLKDTVQFSASILRKVGDRVLVLTDGSAQAKGILERRGWPRGKMVIRNTGLRGAGRCASGLAGKENRSEGI